jgi:hypothetical protein
MSAQQEFLFLNENPTNDPRGSCNFFYAVPADKPAYAHCNYERSDHIPTTFDENEPSCGRPKLSNWLTCLE